MARGECLLIFEWDLAKINQIVDDHSNGQISSEHNNEMEFMKIGFKIYIYKQSQ